MSLKREVDRKSSGRCGRVFLERLKAEHQDRVLAGRGRKTAHFKPATAIGGGGNLGIGTALRRYRGARDRLTRGPHDSALDFGIGYNREHQ
jgi:hypothetical protein